MKDDILIEVKNISKEYDLGDRKFKALDTTSFTLRKNESIGLIGKNGSGKSTLLKILAGLIKPSTGTVSINGKVNSLIEIGSNFIPDLTGRENVKLFLKLSGIAIDKIEPITEEVKIFSELDDFFEKPTKFYSSGMFVRLAISAGFHLDADIFLIDEVLMAGDAQFRQKVASHFKDLLRKGKCLLLASHNPEDILEYCSECFWLDQGVIVERKLASEAMHDYYIHNANLYANKKDDLLNYAFSFKKDIIDFSKIDKESLQNNFLRIIDFKITKSSEISYSSGFEIGYEIITKSLKNGAKNAIAFKACF